MTDPYQQNQGPQYGPPGTGPDLNKPADPYAQPGPDPYAQQPGGYPPAPYPQGPGGADPEAPYGRNQFGEPYSDKQKLTAGLLQLLIGSLGIGRFYLGHNGIAIAQLLTCGGCGVWALVDAILIFTDKVRDPQGRPLRD